MFSQRRRRWTNQKAELVQRLVCRVAAGEKAPVELSPALPSGHDDTNVFRYRMAFPVTYLTL